MIIYNKITNLDKSHATQGDYKMAFTYFLVLAINSFLISWIPFYFLIRLIKANHNNKGFVFKPIILFKIFLFCFEIFNGSFTFVMDTSDIFHEKALRTQSITIYVILDFGRALISLIMLIIICQQSDNEKDSLNSGLLDKSESTISVLDFQL